ncbi:GmrSD restriction endonuclease domain-containing protein [Clostridium cadaveris]|uniref:GmrSD restriction endonuclease domain-containing protein n=1 Tax=Clostridium cadaveris TaxID=1529 RepID=UPI0015B704D4|nr:DUF262 domain-containing protein [Clostridium cadaveris]NWK10792.1 DUF262 domain-containing protein [Clostridium cadaveris]
MRINKLLKQAVTYNPTKKSFQMSVQDMCKKINDNTLTLPLYQRDVSWTLQKSVDLLNYQLFGKAPVAPISINQLSKMEAAVPQVSFIDREVIANEHIKTAHQSVVDGQQRLTTNYKAYKNNDDFRNVVLDVSAANFKIAKGAIKKSQIPVGILLNEDRSILQDYLTKEKTFNDLYALCIDVRSKLMDYNYTINQAEDLTEDEQIEWFEVLNNAGSKVTALQMSFSKLKAHDFDIYVSYINPFKGLIQEYGFDEMFSPFTTNVSYPISSLNSAYEVIVNNRVHKLNYAPIPSDTKESQLTGLDVSSLNQIIDLSLSALKESLDFISDHELNKYIDRMDYILYMTGYFAFYSGSSQDTEKVKILLEWIRNVDFTNQSNGTRRMLFQDLLSL